MLWTPISGVGRHVLAVLLKNTKLRSLLWTVGQRGISLISLVLLLLPGSFWSFWWDNRASILIVSISIPNIMAVVAEVFFDWLIGIPRAYARRQKLALDVCRNSGVA